MPQTEHKLCVITIHDALIEDGELAGEALQGERVGYCRERPVTAVNSGKADKFVRGTSGARLRAACGRRMRQEVAQQKGYHDIVFQIPEPLILQAL